MGLGDKGLDDWFWAIAGAFVGILLISFAFDMGFPVVGFILIGALLFWEYLCLGV